jgi:hypothetical protein
MARRGDGPGKQDRPKDDDYPDVLPEDSRTDFALEATAAAASLLPGLGGVIANVLSGWSAERKRERVREVLEDLALRLANVQARLSDEYVRSEEFEDLLDQALRRVAGERHESKRRLYREFLVGAITSPAPYDEQLRVLRTLEELQAAHIVLIRAVLQEPNPRYFSGISGSQLETLKRRMPDFTDEQLADLAALLKGLGVVTLNSLQTMMTPRGAEDLRHSVTPFGQRFVAYILAADREAGEDTR